jgi:hypothetical protein
MNWNLAVNIVVIVLVTGGLFYAWRLQKLLKTLGRDKEHIEKVMAGFTASVTRAEKAIADLKAAARDVGGDVEQHFTRAQSLRDELHFLVDTADKIAARLVEASTNAQNGVKEQRAALRAAEKENVKESAKENSKESPLDAIFDKSARKTDVKAHIPAPAPVQQTAQPAMHAANTQASIPAWARPVADDVVVINRKAEVPKETPKAETSVVPLAEKTIFKSPPQPQPRSQAERELMQALEKMR